MGGNDFLVVLCLTCMAYMLTQCLSNAGLLNLIKPLGVTTIYRKYEGDKSVKSHHKIQLATFRMFVISHNKWFISSTNKLQNKERKEKPVN